MTKQERIAITRILTDLIKADNIIDVGEMEMYALSRKKFGITHEIEKAAYGMSLSESLRVLSKSDRKIRTSILNECENMTVSDGFCSVSEALLLLAIRHCLSDETVGSDEVFSIHYPEITIDDNQILYVECDYNDTLNEDIQHNYRQLCNEFRLIGFNFVYIPYVAAHYRQYAESTFQSVAHFIAPNLSNEEVDVLIERLSNITTVEFCCDQLCNRLGMHSFRNLGPALLVKIGDNYVNNKRYSNFLRVELTDDVLPMVCNIVDNYRRLSTSLQPTVEVNEAQGQFLYHGFYKQLFDMYTIRKGIASSIEIDPYNRQIFMPELGCPIQGLRRKEKALYALVVAQSSEGGVNFNPPLGKKGAAVYQDRIARIKKQYGQWYSLFGGEKSKAPDIENPEIRNPMVSVIRKSVSRLGEQLHNVGDYNIHKDEFGNYTVPLDGRMVRFVQRPGDDGKVVHFK
jgi:hypothetical protein